MSEPWLRELRATREAPDGVADETLARVMHTLDARARTATRVRRALVFTLASVCALGALAHVARRERAEPPAVMPPAAPAPVVQHEEPEAPAQETPALPEVHAPAPRRPARRARVAEPTSAIAPTPTPASAPTPAHEPASAVSPEARASYREAHRKQYGAPPATALAAWDAFLRLQPDGPLAVEARYYRALCLVRLGRHAEARDALAPFARGDHGAFRQRDAERWLSELGGR